MIRFNKEKFAEAVENHPEGKLKIATKSDSNYGTLETLLAGETNVAVSSIEKLADYVGLDVIIDFAPKQETAAAN